MARRAWAAAHSRSLPRRLLTSAMRSCQPAKPYSRATTSWALRCVTGRAALGSWARTRATAAASPAATSRASFLACLRRDSSDGRAGSDLGAAMATSFHDRLYPADHQAERRCETHGTQAETGGSVPLPRVGGALSARYQQYHGAPLRCQPSAKVEGRAAQDAKGAEHELVSAVRI